MPTRSCRLIRTSTNPRPTRTSTTAPSPICCRALVSCYSDPMEACDVYTKECSIAITAKNLAIMAGTLANGGVNPVSRKQLLEKSYVPKVLAEMAVEGLYDTSGAWPTTSACRQRAAWAAASWRSLPATGRSPHSPRRLTKRATACVPSWLSPGLPASLTQMSIRIDYGTLSAGWLMARTVACNWLRV